MSEAGDQFLKEHPGCALWMIAAVAVIVGWAVFFSGPDETNDGASDRGAIDVCHQAVEDQLKAPGTAEFGGERVTSAGNDYSVTGHVDAENGFGALLRLTWSCEATWIEGTRWQPVVAVLDEG